MFPVQVLLPWRILLQKANIRVCTVNTSPILHHNGIRIGWGFVVVDILEVVVEEQTNGPIGSSKLLVDLSSPLDGSGLNQII